MNGISVKLFDNVALFLHEAYMAGLIGVECWSWLELSKSVEQKYR